MTGLSVETLNRIARADALTLGRFTISELFDSLRRHEEALERTPADGEAARLLRAGEAAILAEIRRR